MEKRKSNYDITRDRVEGAFAGYDQEAMIRKFRLDSDEGFLYIRFAAREYRINRKTGRVERLPGLEHAGFNEVMTIFDVLCGSKEDCRLSGEFDIQGFQGKADLPWVSRVLRRGREA